MSSDNDKKERALLRLEAFHDVAGAGGGGGEERTWVLLDNTTAKTRSSDFLTLREIMGVDAGKMKDAFGREYQKLFRSGAGIGAGLITDEYANGIYVSCLPATSTKTADDVPSKGQRLKRNTDGAKLLLESVKERAGELQAGRGTPQRPDAAAQITPNHEPPSTPSPSRRARPGKILRTVNNGDIAAAEEVTISPTAVLVFDSDESKIKWIETVGAELMIEYVTQLPMSKQPSANMQSLAEKVLRRLEDKNRHCDLQWYDTTGRARSQTYLRKERVRAVKETSLKKSKCDLVTRKANTVEDVVASVFSNGADFSTAVIKKIAKKRNLVLFNVSELQLKIEEIVAIRERCGLSSNKMVKLKQAIERTRPDLKNILFLPRLFSEMTKLERDSSLPISIQKIPLITKTEGAKMDLRLWWYLDKPAKMIEKLVSNCIVDNKFEESFEFCNLLNQLVVVWGIDKSSHDTGLACRIGNRADGNSRHYTQLLAAFEDAVENYANLRDTFFSDGCPLKQFLQALMYDHYQMLTVRIGSQCQSVVFNPYPHLAMCSVRKIESELVGAISEADAEDAETYPTTEPTDSLPPVARILTRCNKLQVRLVVSDAKEGGGKIVEGFQLENDGEVILARPFDDAMSLPAGAELMSVAKVNIMQVNGHISADLKQLLLETGIISVSSLCPCITCLRLHTELHTPSERFQRLRMSAQGIEGPVPLADAPLRQGENSYLNLAKQYAALTDNGSFKLQKKVEMAVKEGCGSQQRYPLIDIPPQKQNGGVMHESGGWVNHFYASVRAWLRSVERKGKWIEDARRISNAEIVEALAVYNTPKAGEGMTGWRQSYNENRGKTKKATDLQLLHHSLKQRRSAGGEGIPTEQEVAAAKVAADQALFAAKHHSKSTGLEHQNLLKSGLEDMQSNLKEYLKKGSKKPRGPAEFAFTRGVQVIAGGKYQAQNSGFDLSTGNGIDTLERFGEVADAVEQVYPPSHEFHSKIKEKFVAFRKLAETLHPFMTYTKSQKKRTVEDFLARLDPALAAWDAAFPDKKTYFLKLHHIMAHLPDYVETYGMLGRVSEESFESVHALIAEIKALVRTLPSDKQRITKATQKAQLKLTPGVMGATLVIAAKDGTRKKEQVPRAKPSIESASASQLSHTFATVTFEEKEYIELPNGNGRLPKEWKELYSFVTAGNVPADWSGVFDESANLTDVKKQEATYATY